MIMKNITWDDLSISDLGFIYEKANEQIKMGYDSMRKDVSKGWWKLPKYEIVPDEAIQNEINVWIKRRDKAILLLDQRMKSLATDIK